MVLLFLTLFFQAEKVPDIKLMHAYSLGGDTMDENQLFGAASSLTAADNGELFVLDTRKFRVLVFDQKGTFLRSFGRQGKGPGEFDEPMACTMDTDGNLLIFDTGSHKLIVLNKEGDFVREAQFALNIHGAFQPTVLSNGNIAFTSYKISEGFQFFYDLSLYKPDMSPIIAFHTETMSKLDWDQAENPSFWSGFLAEQFQLRAGRFPMAAAVGDALFTAQAGTYKIQVHNDNGQARFDFEQNQKPKLLNDEAKYALCEPIWQNFAANPALANQMTQSVFDRAVEEVEGLDVMPPVLSLVTVGEYLAVVTQYDMVAQKGQIDWYDRKGTRIGVSAYEGPAYGFAGAKNALYAIGLDDDDNMVIRKFEVNGLPQ